MLGWWRSLTGRAPKAPAVARERFETPAEAEKRITADDPIPPLNSPEWAAFASAKTGLPIRAGDGPLPRGFSGLPGVDGLWLDGFRRGYHGEPPPEHDGHPLWMSGQIAWDLGRSRRREESREDAI